MILQQNSVDILALSETWLNDSWPDAVLTVPGYCCYRRDRSNSTGGGILIYVKSSLFSQRLAVFESDGLLFEDLYIEFRQPHSSPILFVCIYRPPDSSSSDFTKKLGADFEKRCQQIQGNTCSW